MINGGQSHSDAQPVSPVGKKEGSTTMVPHTAWLPELLQPLICQVFQRFVLEGDEENRKILHQVSRRDTLIKLFSTIKYVNSGYYFLVHNHCGYVQEQAKTPHTVLVLYFISMIKIRYVTC